MTRSVTTCFVGPAIGAAFLLSLTSAHADPAGPYGPIDPPAPAPAPAPAPPPPTPGYTTAPAPAPPPVYAAAAPPAPASPPVYAAVATPAPAYGTAAPAASAAAAPAPERSYAIGVTAMASGDGDGRGLGIFGRKRMNPRLQVEIALTSLEYDRPRSDTSLGAGLIYDLTEVGGLMAYGVVGAGFNRATSTRRGDDEQSSVTQGYLEAGAGLAWSITPALSLSGDLRLQARRGGDARDARADHADDVTPVAGDENGVAAHLGLALSL